MPNLLGTGHLTLSQVAMVTDLRSWEITCFVSWGDCDHRSLMDGEAERQVLTWPLVPPLTANPPLKAQSHMETELNYPVLKVM